MRRIVFASCIAATLAFSACGGDPAAAPAATATPAPVSQGGILAPAQRAQNTVDQLNQMTNRTEQQTGAGGNVYDGP